ncbi:MAG: sugar ABC transporter permease [Chloroflexi bacterium]|nr:sugar ABC transporter permease [Chloroflexota bacterium]
MNVSGLEIASREKEKPKGLIKMFLKAFGKNPYARSKNIFIIAMLTPILFIYFYLRVYPILRTFVLSLYNWNFLLPNHTFIGFQNFVSLFSDDHFLLALKNTTIFSLATVILGVVVSLPLSIVLAGKMKFSPFYQAVFFLPYITPMAAMAVAWKWIYDSQYGILNYFLSIFHIPPVGWLVYPDTALWAIIIMSVWKNIGYNMILFMVGIKNIPISYTEAAQLDGAGRFDMFRYITFPLLQPMLLFVLVTSTINAYNVFTQVYVMTLGSQSAPGSAVNVLVYDIYTNFFQYHKAGYASAEAVVLTLIVLVLTLIQFRFIRNREE